MRPGTLVLLSVLGVGAFIAYGAASHSSDFIDAHGVRWDIKQFSNRSDGLTYWIGADYQGRYVNAPQLQAPTRDALLAAIQVYAATATPTN